MRESQLGISVKMELGWTDPRLTFTNMASKTRLDEAIDQIWKPTIVFVGAKYEDNVNLQQGVNIMRFLFAESSTKGVTAVVNSTRGEAVHKDVRMNKRNLPTQASYSRQYLYLSNLCLNLSTIPTLTTRHLSLSNSFMIHFLSVSIESHFI